MGRKYVPVIERNGRSEWLFPVMRNYKMRCCDCSLIHSLDFAVYKVLRTKRDGTFTAIRVVGLKIALRAGRDRRATAQARRKKK